MERKGTGGDKEGNWGQSQETRTRERGRRSQWHVLLAGEAAKRRPAKTQVCGQPQGPVLLWWWGRRRRVTSGEGAVLADTRTYPSL